MLGTVRSIWIKQDNDGHLFVTIERVLHLAELPRIVKGTSAMMLKMGGTRSHHLLRVDDVSDAGNEGPDALLCFCVASYASTGRLRICFIAR
jgi:hypothetical protein